MKYLPLFLVFLLSACSIKEYKHTSSKVIIMKSPKINFSDLGFIRNSGSAIELELFVAGNAIEKIAINHLICVTAGCMSKDSFNAEYLHSSYPNTLLQNILLSKPIYEEKNKIKTQDGFKQEINDENVQIKYIVTQNSVYFKDRKNKIILKIKDTQ